MTVFFAGVPKTENTAKMQKKDLTEQTLCGILKLLYYRQNSDFSLSEVTRAMKAIHKPFRLVLLAVLLIGIFAVGCAAADESLLPELLPDSVTGAYNYTYAEGEPHASYLVFMLAGTYTESDTPTLSAADGNVLYYNHVRADENGNVLLSFVPMSYKDGTVFLSSAASKKPLALCYAKAGDAKDLADFSLTLDAEEYTLKGGNEPTYVRYTVKAVDSFGFAAKLPSFAKRTIVGMRVMPSKFSLPAMPLR